MLIEVALIVPFTSNVYYGFVVPIPTFIGLPELSVILRFDPTKFKGYTVDVVLSMDYIYPVLSVPLNYIYNPFGAVVFVFVLARITVSPPISSLEVGTVSTPNPSGL